jgi:leucyl aminopeptidase
MACEAEGLGRVALAGGVAANGALREAVKTEFQAKPGKHIVLRDLPGIAARRVVLVGLGKQAEYKAKTHAQAEQVFVGYCVQARLTEAVSTLASINCPDTSLTDRARALAVAATQATYHYDATVGKADANDRPKLKKLALAGIERGQQQQAQKGLAQGQAIGAGMLLARKLGDLPGNVCTPTYLADTARRLARTHKSLNAQVLGAKQIAALKMGAFLSVAKGSYEPPAFIVLRHAPAKSKKAPIVLVGKGLTFDAGGISLKPAANMDEMKYDMCGAASVLGAMQAVAELNLDREVIGVIGSCENLPSGRANKPGDVVTSMSGQTIEILNTDAEGRLVLCDALTYVERFKPDAVIDIATLTGACVVALGHVNTGLFTKDDDFAAQLLAAGKQAGDTAWRMPLEDAYQEQLRSNFADVANIGGPPAGSVTAACFLARFAGKYRWAHLDIAGTAWRSGKDKGASGRPVPLLVQYLLNHG